MRKPLLISFFVTCATLAGAYGADTPATHSSTTAPSAPTALIKHGALAIAIDAQGAFDPVDDFEVRLRFKAYIGDLTITSIVPNGAAVRKGDVILELDPATLKRTLAAAENEALAANASLEKTKADMKVSEQVDALALRQQQEALSEAEQGVKWFDTVDGPQMLKGIELGVAAAKNQMDDEQDELNQLKKMYKSEELTNATADIVVRRAVRQLETSKTGYAMAEERATKQRMFIYPVTKQRVYDALDAARHQFAYFQASQEQTKILRQTGLATYVAAADAANLKRDELKSDADKLIVHAPFDGIVNYGQIINGAWSGGDARTLRAGEHVTAQTVLMTLYQPGRLRVALELPETKFFAIQPGQKVSLSPVAFPELKYEGMCDVAPRAASSSSGNYTLFVSTGSVDTRVVPGIKAQVHMDVTLADSVLLAPLSAVVNSTVQVKTATGSVSRRVMTGRSDAKSVEILSGLHDGDLVVVPAN